MRRLLRDTASHAQLEERGWAPLPALSAAELTRLRELAAAMGESFSRLRLGNDEGFEQLCDDPELGRRAAAEREVDEVLLPFIERIFAEHRTILTNLFIKRAASPGSTVPFHEDPAVLDERDGETALQLWIPLYDLPPEQGRLLLVERSHVDAEPLRACGYVHPLAVQPLSEPPEGTVEPAVRAGLGVVFSSRTVHASPPNSSDVDRPVAVAIVVPAAVPLLRWAPAGEGRLGRWPVSDAEYRVVPPNRVPDGVEPVEHVAMPVDHARPPVAGGT